MSTKELFVGVVGGGWSRNLGGLVFMYSTKDPKQVLEIIIAIVDLKRVPFVSTNHPYNAPGPPKEDPEVAVPGYCLSFLKGHFIPICLLQLNCRSNQFPWDCRKPA